MQKDYLDKFWLLIQQINVAKQHSLFITYFQFKSLIAKLSLVGSQLLFLALLGLGEHLIQKRHPHPPRFEQYVTC